MWATDASLACTFFNAAYLGFTGRTPRAGARRGLARPRPPRRPGARAPGRRPRRGRQGAVRGALPPAPPRRRLPLGLRTRACRCSAPTARSRVSSAAWSTCTTSSRARSCSTGSSPAARSGSRCSIPSGATCASMTPTPRSRACRLEAHAGRSVDEVLPAAIAPAADQMLDQVMRTGEASHGVVMTARRGRRRRAPSDRELHPARAARRRARRARGGDPRRHRAPQRRPSAAPSCSSA